MKHSFDNAYSVRMSRSRFDLSHGLKTSLNEGDLVPLDVQEVLPGDTFKSKFTAVIRSSNAFLKPVMDNAFMDVYSFFVPLRLCYKDAQEVFGVAKPSSYTQDNLKSMPVTVNNSTVYSKTIADYLGLPVGTVPAGISIAPFRAFARIYNEWFRNENTVDEVYVQDGAFSSYEVLNNNAFSPNNYTGKLPKVGKKKDYFTSCLPNPQKGAPVLIPISAPVSYTTGSSGAAHNFITSSASLPVDLVQWSSVSGNSYDTAANLRLYNPNTSAVSALNPIKLNTNGLAAVNAATNVNDLRLAFQLQKCLERDAIFGSRYNEILLSHFGVSSPDSRLQITEFLGGGRIPINIQQVAQTGVSSTDDGLAEVGAFSLSVGSQRYVKGFVEHGYVITVGCIRQLHTYQQGIPKTFFRKDREDFYDPLFANLGYQPVYTSELYLQSTLKTNIFGYNEAWADYRYAPSRITGEMRSSATNSLDIWHFADNYGSAPTLGQSFTDETPSFMDRTLAVPSTSQDQFILDGWFDVSAIRVMPTYSVPGLIDHH